MKIRLSVLCHGKPFDWEWLWTGEVNAYVESDSSHFVSENSAYGILLLPIRKHNNSINNNNNNTHIKVGKSIKKGIIFIKLFFWSKLQRGLGEYERKIQLGDSPCVFSPFTRLPWWLGKKGGLPSARKYMHDKTESPYLL